MNVVSLYLCWDLNLEILVSAKAINDCSEAHVQHFFLFHFLAMYWFVVIYYFPFSYSYSIAIYWEEILIFSLNHFVSNFLYQFALFIISPKYAVSSLNIFFYWYLFDAIPLHDISALLHSSIAFTKSLLLLIQLNVPNTLNVSASLLISSVVTSLNGHG